MWLIFLSLILGFLVGGFINITKRQVLLNQKIQNISLFLLIFFMGLGLGGNKDIIKSLYSIGFKAFLYALFAVVGSVIITFFISKLFISDIEDGD